MQLLKETKETGNKIEDSSATHVTFSNGNRYTYDNDEDILYLETSDEDGNSKNIKIAEYVTDLAFDLTNVSDSYNEEQCLEVTVTIEKSGKEIERTLKYIITTSSI